MKNDDEGTIHEIHEVSRNQAISVGVGVVWVLIQPSNSLTPSQCLMRPSRFNLARDFIKASSLQVLVDILSNSNLYWHTRKLPSEA